MVSRFRLILVGIVLVAGVLVVVVLTGGDDKKPVAQARDTGPLPPIKGPQIGVEGLVYNVTNVHVLDFDDPLDAPYLTNLSPTEGTELLGVFVRIYNTTGKNLPSAPGFLLEPTKQPGLVEQNNASESPFRLEPGATVKAKSMLPEPVTAAAKGTTPGALIVYPISKETTDAQPFDLVVHTSNGALVRVRLPQVPKLHA